LSRAPSVHLSGGRLGSEVHRTDGHPMSQTLRGSGKLMDVVIWNLPDSVARRDREKNNR
jgi:hypothetical protein